MVVVYAAIFFMADTIIATLTHGWHVRLLVAYVLGICTYPYLSWRDMMIHLTLPMFFLLLQDAYLYQRCGLFLIYMIPLIIAAHMMNKVVMRPTLLIPLLGLLYFLSEFLIKKALFLYDISINVTMTVFCTTIIAGYIILWGTRGNRSAAKF